MEASLQISLPLPLKEWLDREAASKGFPSSSELVEDLIRREQSRASIDEKLHHSVASGESTPVSPAEWDRLRTIAHERAARQSTHG
jgi:antitoxin ParD1/3/4